MRAHWFKGADLASTYVALVPSIKLGEGHCDRPDVI